MDSTHNFETFYIIRFFSEVENVLEKMGDNLAPRFAEALEFNLYFQMGNANSILQAGGSQYI